MNSEYERGLEDAWKCATKLVEKNFYKVFGTNDLWLILNAYHPTEAISKIAEYDKKEQT